MAPGEMNVFQAAAFRVDAGSSLVFRLAAVGIVGEELMKDDLVRIGAAYWKRIADHGPLRLSVKTEDFSQIVNEARQDEPARMSIPADLFGRLKQMLKLRQIGIGIAIIDQRVQKLHRFPDSHSAPRQRQKSLLLGLYEIVSLMAVIEPVELAHAGPCAGFIISKLLFGLIGVRRLKRF